MRICGRSTTCRLGLAIAFLTAFAGASVAAQVWTTEVPACDAYVATAVLAPGPCGAEVCAIDRGNGHIDFRVGFGSDLLLSVNGADAGPFDPNATYVVTVECKKMGDSWFATTRLADECTGQIVFEQIDFKMPGDPREVRAGAKDVFALDVK